MSPKEKAIKAKVNKAVQDAIGYLCWWTLHEHDIPVVDMEAALNATLGAKYLPGKPRKKRALRQALNAVEDAGLVVKIRDDNDVAAYGLGSEVVDAKKTDFNLEKQNIVLLDKKTGNIEFRMQHKNDEIQKLFARYQDCYTADDVRPIALDYLYKHNGVTLRDTGGIYFAPDLDTCLTLENFFKAVGCEFFYLAQSANEHNTTVVREIAVKEFEKDLELAAADVEFFTGKDDTREGTLAARISKFNLLQSRADTYGELLKLGAAEIAAKIESLRGIIEKKLLGKDEKYPQAVNFPHKCRVKVNDPADDKWNGRIGLVVGYDFHTDKKGNREPLLKVLWDDGEFVPVFANPDWLEVVT